MAEHSIAVIGGDGIGPEVVAQGVRVLKALAEKRELQVAVKEFDLGAERYLADGTTFPDEVAQEIEEEHDAVLLGALGDPRVADMRHARDILFGLRFGLDLFANVRPVVCLHDRLMPLVGKTARDCNFTVFRENTEGVYAGVGGQFKRGTPDEVAITEDINTRKGVERIIRSAFDFARANEKTRVHMADKSNAMPDAHGLWQRTFRELAKEYPEIEAEHVYVDALCLYLVQDPSQFEVVVTNNLFGDIVTDLGAGLQGGLGMAASAQLRPGAPGLFEPVHGSAPPLAGKNQANPFATVLSIGMLLADLGHPDEELVLIDLVQRALEQGVCTRDVGGTHSTSDVGDWLVEQLQAG